MMAAYIPVPNPPPVDAIAHRTTNPKYNGFLENTVTESRLKDQEWKQYLVNTQTLQAKKP